MAFMLAHKLYFAIALIQNVKIDARNEIKVRALQLLTSPSPQLRLKLKSAAAATLQMQGRVVGEEDYGSNTNETVGGRQFY